MSYCIFEHFLGIPCPGCNMTTALYYFLKGNFKASFYFHPFLVPTMISFILWIIFKYKKNTVMCNKILKIWVIGLIGVYIYRMIFVFPNFPMGYQSDNFLNNFINFLKSC